MNQQFSRPLIYERVFLRSPMNEVIVIAQINGHLSKKILEEALIKVSEKHPLLCSKISIDPDGKAEFVNEGYCKFEINEFFQPLNQSGLEFALSSVQKSFQINKAPLIKFGLIYNENITELVIICHHIICDGLSLMGILQDILKFASNPLIPTKPIKELPLIIQKNLPSNYHPSKLVTWFISRINKKWMRDKVIFSELSFQKMHAITWQNKSRRVYTKIFSREITKNFIERCQKENITVNSAVSTAILIAQNMVLDLKKKKKYTVSMAIDLRNKLKVDIGDALGLYAGVLFFRLRLDPSRSFLEESRKIHLKILKHIIPKKIYALTLLNLFDPNLIDAIYFQNTGIIDINIVQKFSNLVDIHKLKDGVAITNLRNILIPPNYGNFQLNSLIFIPPWVMKHRIVMGLWSFNGRLGYSLNYWEPRITRKEVERITQEFNEIIEHISSK